MIIEIDSTNYAEMHNHVSLEALYLSSFFVPKKRKWYN